MKELADFLGFMIVFFLICFLFSGVGIHTINETDATMDYKTKDMVYILPDSIPGMVEGGMVFTRKHKDEITKIKTNETFYQIYTVVYTDKNGVVQRIKNLKSELLIKRNEN